MAQAIAQAVRSGELLPGTRLPPRRAVAQRLKMNLSTVSKAYDLAAEMGVVAGEVGRGTFVRLQSIPERIPWPKTGGSGALDLSSNFPFPSVAREELDQAFTALGALPFS
ncbi:MAG TPA: winged helix-turn-helix domain-containing protein, partial [Nordella sp.]|nr:winged helix-turn-helix domain-containing protein [Nordella sp.]